MMVATDEETRVLRRIIGSPPHHWLCHGSIFRRPTADWAAAYGRYRSAFQLKYYHQCQCSRANQSTGPYALERIRLANMLFFSIPTLVRVTMRHSLMG